MNSPLDTFESRQELAKKGFDTFIKVMEKACSALKKEFKLRERDDEHIDFELDRYDLSLVWCEKQETILIGTKIWLVEYQLLIWHTSPGNYWNPPEAVDTELLTSQNLYACAQKAIETVVLDGIGQVMQGVSMDLGMEEEQKQEEM